MTDKIQELKKLKSALESGKYPKTKNTLKGTLPEGGVGYCCIGVYATLKGYDLVTQEGFGSSDEWCYDNEGDRTIYDEVGSIFGEGNVMLLIDENDSSESWDIVIKIIDEIIQEESY